MARSSITSGSLPAVVIVAPLALAAAVLAGQPAAAATEGPARVLTEGVAAHPPPECHLSVCPPAPSAYGTVPSRLRGLGDRLWFAGGDAEHGGEPWVSDGTPEGTFMLLDVYPGGESSEPVPVGVLEPEGESARLVFWATDPNHGREPWVTDGTRAGTRRLADLCPGPCSAVSGVAAWWGEWSDPYPGAVRGAVLGGELLFGADVPTDAQLYATDGTPEGTRLVAEPCRTDCYRPPLDFVRSGDHVYFVVHSGGLRGTYELWRTDGTAAGTRRLEEPCRATGKPSGGQMVPFDGGLAYIGGCDSGSGRTRDVSLRFHRPDGGTVDLGVAFPRSLAVVGDSLFALRISDEGRSEIWTSDGTPGGTHRSLELDLFVVELHSLLGRLFLEEGAVAVADRVTGRRLFVTDGTDLPVPVHDDPLERFSPLYEVLGRATWWELAGISDGELRWHLVSWDPLEGRRVEQVFTTPETVPELEADRAYVPPTHRVVGPTLFVSADGGGGTQLWEMERTDVGPTCFESPQALCLRDGRFEVRVRFRNQHAGGVEGVATPDEASRALALDTGYLWFFRPENLELAVKVLDGRPVNGHWWVFAGGTTDLEYELEVTDRLSGTTRRWTHAPGDLCAVASTNAFEAVDTPASPAPVAAPHAVPAGMTDGDPRSPSGPRPVTAPLTPPPPPECDWFGGSAACIGPDQRFQVRVEYRNQHAGGESGAGRPFPETEDTATVSFFPHGAVEMMVKVLDGRPVNGHWWVLYGGLTDVAYTLRVTDRDRDRAKEYENTPFSQCGGADTTAFAAP